MVGQGTASTMFTGFFFENEVDESGSMKAPFIYLAINVCDL